MKLALAITAVIVAPALGITIAGRLACWAVERAVARLGARRTAPRTGSSVRPGGAPARPLSSDEAARREVLSDWRRTTHWPPGGADA